METYRNTPSQRLWHSRSAYLPASVQPIRDGASDAMAPSADDGIAAGAETPKHPMQPRVPSGVMSKGGPLEGE